MRVKGALTRLSSQIALRIHANAVYLSVMIESQEYKLRQMSSL
jgi:hypothetical protein